jgi:predicted XRE-type DNA-binding protein
MADKALKGRVVCKVGEANHLSRISANVALSIRHAVDGGMSQVDAAKKFGIGQTQVSRLVRGDAWA